MITTTAEDTIWFGYNEDRNLEQFEQVSYVRFHTSTDNSLSYMEITAEAPNLFSVRVGVNEAGVAISGNGLPEDSLNPHPEKRYSWKYNSLYRLILEKSSNIFETIEIVNSYDFGPSMSFQIHVADANGDAIVVSPGTDGEIAITQKNHQYLISTNVNRDKISSGSFDSRYEMALSMLDRDQSFGMSSLKSTLECVHQESYEGYTYYSTIFDLSRGIVYLYPIHDFEQEISFNITQELLLGDHYYLLSDLFPDGAQILENAQAEMSLQMTIFTGARILGLVISLPILLHLASDTRLIWKSDHSRNNKITRILTSSGVHVFMILFVVSSSLLIPAIFLTNIIESSVQSGVYSLELQLVSIFWTIGLFALGYKIMITNSRSGSSGPSS